uniref:UrcA family protein n=1 Tax=Asticcacaulis sp. TaxID=1872648 RepID=UPI002617D55D
LSLSLVTPVSAEQRDIETRAVVQLPAVLSDAKAVEKAYARLKVAAKRACDSGLAHDSAAKASDRACGAAALDRAVQQSNLPALVAYHEGKVVNGAVYADNSDRSAAQR